MIGQRSSKARRALPFSIECRVAFYGNDMANGVCRQRKNKLLFTPVRQKRTTLTLRHQRSLLD
eukprot:scaffold9078_cov129-Cylindrotheca_fusiformis.AAC.10